MTMTDAPERKQMMASNQCVTRAFEGEALAETAEVDSLLEEGFDMGPDP
jgi:hypothetical protein